MGTSRVSRKNELFMLQRETINSGKVSIYVSNDIFENFVLYSESKKERKSESTDQLLTKSGRFGKSTCYGSTANLSHFMPI